jgi:hypothetical protein
MKKGNNNGDNNVKQRGDAKKPGGVTGKGFRPGQSGNPKGRPSTRGLIAALRAAVAETVKDGRTVEQELAQMLVREALHGRRKLTALAEIFDRLEGRPKQQLDLNDISKEMQGRTNDELIAFAQTGKWPEEEQENG